MSAHTPTFYLFSEAPGSVHEVAFTCRGFLPRRRGRTGFDGRVPAAPILQPRPSKKSILHVLPRFDKVPELFLIFQHNTVTVL